MTLASLKYIYIISSYMTKQSRGKNNFKGTFTISYKANVGDKSYWMSFANVYSFTNLSTSKVIYSRITTTYQFIDWNYMLLKIKCQPVNEMLDIY